MVTAAAAGQRAGSLSGRKLRRFVLAQYHQGQVTGAAGWVTLLRALGILISKRKSCAC